MRAIALGVVMHRLISIIRYILAIKMSNILYSVAYTQEGHLIKAANAQKRQPYTCPNCNRNLILRSGKIKRPHFAHKTLSVNCSPETALHYIFKTLLCKKIQQHLERKIPLSS